MSLINKPLVSVIISSYNHADFVEDSIKSVLKQSLRNIEIIIVDDGSTDGTNKKIRKFKDPRIRFTQILNNRQINPRNLALKSAKGRYIAFQNSDDIWENNKLEQQIKQFKIHKNLSACFTGIKIISEKGLIFKNSWAENLFTTQNRKSEEWLRHFFDIGNCLCISSAVISHKALRKIGLFDESLMNLSDFDLWVRLSTTGEFYIIDEKLTKMRIVKDKNFSAPNPKSQRRSSMEFAQVLDRFTNKRSVVDIEKVFKDLYPDKEPSTLIKKAYITRYAWGKSSSHRLYADRLFASLIGNTQNRNKITEHFGAEIIHEFIKKKQN